MSKTLVIVRHAKSSWSDPVLADFERPLNRRGERDAPRMAQRLADLGANPDTIISSPANRALTTARTFATTLGVDTTSIEPDERLYLASSDTLFAIVREQPASVACLMIFGHNPGMTEFVNRLGNCDIDNLPTCAYAVFTIAADDWQSVRDGGAVLDVFDFPKNRAAAASR